jgi:asparagine synthase (glutamine-hydrolysing)
MISSLTHRGPDDEGTFESVDPEGTVWLAHRRLAILDLSSVAHQPMTDATSRFVLVFNGELYNYAELRAELIRSGHSFRGTGDTEVLLAAWAQWGVEALQRFRGMFAFALWDSVDRTLWLARDRLGEKPLYFTAQAGRLLFASELRSLLASERLRHLGVPQGGSPSCAKHYRRGDHRISRREEHRGRVRTS